MPARINLSSLLLLAGCAANPDAPSLAPRAIETRATFTEPTSTPAAASADPALDARASAALTRAQAGDTDFTAILATTSTTIARGAGAPEGSEAWIDAQQALSALDAARGPAAAALSDLEALRLEAAAREAAVDLTRIDDALTQVTAIVERQQRALDSATAQTPSG